MEGFGAGVDGFYDPENQIADYVRRRADEYFERERTEKRGIETEAGHETRSDRVRRAFLDSIGGLPERPDDLAVEVVGTQERDGYAVQRVVYESQRDFHVTANCYVPEGEGPHPAVVFPCGHHPDAKAETHNQRACAQLALNGVVSLIFDPLAQGERRQYDDPDASDPHVHSGVYGHSRAGWKCYLAGANVARYMLTDALAGVDYLCDRPDVDQDRIGAVGTSGGGMLTQYLTLVEDRLAAAAPCCSFTDRREWLKTGKSMDAEARLYGAVSRGINYDDFVAAAAPRPVCVCAARSDFFPIEGVSEAFERAKRRYALYDAAENLDLLVRDGGHSSVYEFGEPLFEWLCERLDAGEYVSHDGLDGADAADLQCTPAGSVRDAYPDERTVEDLLREDYLGDTPSTVGDVDSDAVRGAVVDRFDLDREAPTLRPRFVHEAESDGLDVRRVFFETERNPEAVVTGILASDPDVTDRTPSVVLYEDGTDELPDRSQDVAALAREHGTALLFDPRGTGAVAHRDLPTWYAVGPNDYREVYGTEYTIAHDALLLESSLFEMRVYDVCRALAFLRDETSSDEVGLVGEGVGAYHALFAAVADESVAALDLRALGPTFREMATADVEFDPRLVTYDVIEGCDVPHLLAALEERDVTVDA